MSTPSRRQIVLLQRARLAQQARDEAEERRITTLVNRGLQQINAYLRTEAQR
jgi:hypothetical protein